MKQAKEKDGSVDGCLRKFAPTAITKVTFKQFLNIMDFGENMWFKNNNK